MYALATLWLGLSVAQVAETPFRIDLPAGYPAFSQPNPAEEAWISIHESGAANFEVRHFLLNAPGAITERVAENLRNTRWKPMLLGVQHTMVPWNGTWAGEVGAGTSIEYLHDENQRYLEQRLVVLDEHLIIANWEGVIDQKQAAQKALASFKLPSIWKPLPAPEMDVHRGMRDSDQLASPIGHFFIRIDASENTFQSVHFDVTWTPADGVTPHGKVWYLPEGAQVEEVNKTSISYTIALFEGTRAAPKAGLLPGASGLSGLGGAWLAMPTSYTPTATSYIPPNYTLEIISPSYLEAISSSAIKENSVTEDGQQRRTLFEPCLNSKAWPYFVIGMFEYKKTAGHAIAIRRSSKAARFEKTLGLMARLQQGLTDWLPAARSQWSVATFPGAGDLIFPGLFVFDEANNWLSDPVDSDWFDGNRRAGLARKLSYHVFGRQVTGLGHGSVFLDASLSEYAAWRILESTSLIAEADAMQAFWIANEKALGELTRPLTLMPISDLQGAKRLMTRGALVWLAIEKRATRPLLDQTLNSILKSSEFWSTEDLRLALEKHTKEDWTPFFQAHVYGRKRP
ncbi:MAG: hypothetical protein HQ519_14770 [Planctomycetes bacterium]|nr:hypothetical protein [Planctomycetota bacterium]